MIWRWLELACDLQHIWPMNTSLCWLHRSCLGLRRLKTCSKILKRYFTDYVTLKDVIEDVEQKVRPIRILFMSWLLCSRPCHKRIARAGTEDTSRTRRQVDTRPAEGARRPALALVGIGSTV